jgi:hypothetical protein
MIIREDARFSRASVLTILYSSPDETDERKPDERTVFLCNSQRNRPSVFDHLLVPRNAVR